MVAPVDLRMKDGAVIRLRFHGNSHGPLLALSHGNGLAIDGYRPFWELLLDRWQVVLFDFRNHGANPRHQDHHDWPAFIDDMEVIFQALRDFAGSRPIFGAFHSMSAVACARHCLDRGRRWNRLVLFDPPFSAPSGHPFRAISDVHVRRLAEQTIRRRDQFADRVEATRYLRRVRAYARWRPEAYELMAIATTRRESDGRLTLVCPPKLEARIYATNTEEEIWTSLHRMPCPALLVCADPTIAPDSLASQRSRTLAAEARLPYLSIPNTTHFLPLEQPARCVAALEKFLTS